MKKNGTIGVTTENIFPIIKKFLYSDHEIFLRELVSNAVDATTKLKTLVRLAETNITIDDATITINVDEKAKTLTITDQGIGMTAEEVEKYINQIAFSGAEEFMSKYQDKNIIGHFGLGFYSAFMVADKVEIKSLSYQKDAKAIYWSCDGTPNYELSSSDKTTRGTEITLHLSEDSIEFAKRSRVETLLKKYCSFLPIPIALGLKQEWKDGKMVDLDEPNVINDVNPLWMQKPKDIKTEQYDEFYKKLYPMSEDPLFHIHLNVDYPFTLTGILYFPKIKSNIELQKNKIQLYSNQVFVTDSVEGIVPEFLTLLHGVLDSPDIPLNVSRSYLQSDSNVKKISSHITKKVADRLADIFKNSRADYEKKWDDLKLFIQYGVVSDDKFGERAEEFTLLKNVDGKYFTLGEYTDIIKGNQTDKNNKVVHLYCTDAIAQYNFVEEAKAKGYDVLVMDSPLESHFISMLENKHTDWSFVRVDSNVADKLIEKDDAQDMLLTAEQQTVLTPAFEALLPASKDTTYHIEYAAMDKNSAPVIITQNEFMRRMKDMNRVGGGGMMNFYGDMPDAFNVVVNGNSTLVSQVLKSVEKHVGQEKLATINKKIDKLESERAALTELIKDKKEADLSTEEKDKREAITKSIDDKTNERTKALTVAGKENKIMGQLVDLALLSSGHLKGEKLKQFIDRSISMIK